MGGWINTYFPTVVEAGCLRSRRRRGQVLTLALPPACRWPPSCCELPGPQSTHNRKRQLSGVSSWRALLPTNLVLTLMTSSNSNYLLKALEVRHQHSNAGSRGHTHSVSNSSVRLRPSFPISNGYVSSTLSISLSGFLILCAIISARFYYLPLNCCHSLIPGTPASSLVRCILQSDSESPL